MVFSFNYYNYSELDDLNTKYLCEKTFNNKTSNNKMAKRVSIK